MSRDASNGRGSGRLSGGRRGRRRDEEEAAYTHVFVVGLFLWSALGLNRVWRRATDATNHGGPAAAVPQLGVHALPTRDGDSGPREGLEVGLRLPQGSTVVVGSHPHAPGFLIKRRPEKQRWGDRLQGLVSLQRYPLPLPTPKAALDLEGIGTHLVERFEKYMANFLKEHGPSWADAEAAAGASPLGLGLRIYVACTKLAFAVGNVRSPLADALWQATFDKKGKAKKISPSVAAASATGAGSSAPSQSITPSPTPPVPPEPRIRAHASSNDASSQSSDGGGAGAGAAATADTAYRPRARSGAYAIMIALRRAAVQPGYPGYCTKEQLLREVRQAFTRLNFWG